MKNYIKYLLVLLLVVIIPLKVSASEITDIFIDKDNHLTFTGVEGYESYKAYIKYGSEEVHNYNQISSDKSDDLYAMITGACDKLDEVCPEGYVGDYTLELVALDNDVQVESTRTTKNIKVKHEEYNGDDYYKVDVVGNETKYTITLDPNDDIQGSIVLGSNFIFGQHVVLGSFESYGFEKQPKKLYYGWSDEDFNVTHDMTVEYEWEPLFTMSLNFNGGTLNGKGTYEKEGVGYFPFLSLENLMSAFSNDLEVIPPVGKELHHVTINGVERAIDPEDGFMFNQDTTIVYYWDWSDSTTVRTVTFKDGFGNTLKTVEVADGEKVAQPATPIVGRLLFSCWQKGNDCYNFQTPVTEDLTIEAYWNFNWRVEANVEDAAKFIYNKTDYYDSVSSAGEYHENEIIGIDQEGINGYSIKEWRLDSVEGEIIGTDPNADYYMANGGHLKIKQSLNTSNHVFYAIYEQNTVAVNFVTNGGTPIETQYVVPGERVTRPGLHDSTKEGYILGKWYTDHELLNEFNFNTPVQTELTLYAGWDIYLSEVRGTIGKPVDGFKPETNIVSADSDKYTFSVNYWYYTGEGTPHLEGDATFEKGKEYEVRFHVNMKSGYGVDDKTKYYINDEESSKYGDFVERQIRWIATDPEEVTEFNITGLTAPAIGNTFNNSNIRLTTKGLNLIDTFMTEESTEQVLTANDKFVAGKRYILHVRFNTTYGYTLAAGYDEDAIAGAPEYLKAELVDNFDEFEMRIYFEPIKLQLDAPTAKLSANNNQVTITWNDQGEDKTEVYRSLDNKKWTRISTVTENSFVDKSLTYGKTYYYKVKVKGNGLWSGYSNVVSKKIAPNKVTNLVIKSAGTNNIKIGYDKVSTTGYEIYRSTDNKNWTKVKTITDNKTLEFNNKDLKANKTYYYKVKAYKSVSGTKVYGSYSAVVSTKTAPAKPSFSVKLKDYNAMNLVIGEAKGATKYIVQKSLDGKTWSALEELTKYGTLVDSGNEIGKTYYYAVKVCNSQNRCSGWVKAELKQTTKTPGFSLKTSSKKVTITMSKVNGATGYQIYRATSKNGKYEKVKEFSSEVELLEFVNKTTKGKTYYYKVRSFALDENNARIYSPYSKIKSITSK